MASRAVGSRPPLVVRRVLTVEMVQNQEGCVLESMTLFVRCPSSALPEGSLLTRSLQSLICAMGCEGNRARLPGHGSHVQATWLSRPPLLTCLEVWPHAVPAKPWGL